jgi:mannose-6-phosphate isomerase-like protein (cupin superfamily)
MPVIKQAQAPTFDLPGLHVVGLASPARGARETSVWQLALAAGTEGAPHTNDREEIFVVVAGRAIATVGGDRFELARGDALIVPAATPFALANPFGEPFEAVAALPIGGRAAYPGGEPFVPPWAS